MSFQYLSKDHNNYVINSKANFGTGAQVICSKDDILRVLEFSWSMTFGATGEHRSFRSGGQYMRSDLETFIDVFIGKLGEVAFFNMCLQRPCVKHITEVDYACYGKGQWDSADFIINQQYHIAIKTTKHFGHLLLLEQKDWSTTAGQAIYLPNQHAQSKGKYDFLFFSRVKTNIKALFKNVHLQKQSITVNDKTAILSQLRVKLLIALEVVGYVDNATLAYIIDEKYILPQNATLNGKTRMDASNYYLQSGFFSKVKTNPPNTHSFTI